MKLIIARYKEDVSWAKDYDHFIVQKGEHMDNVGREPASYLWYIINFWDELDGVYAFLQGKPFDHCQKVLEQLEPIHFKWLGDHGYICDMNGKPQHGFNSIDLKKFCKEAGMEYEHRFKRFFGGCLFIASAEQIKKRPKEFYENLFKLVQNEEAQYAWAFERYIDVIFCEPDSGSELD